MAFVLEPSLPFDAWMAEVSTWLERSPGFFNERVVILSLKELETSRDDLLGLIAGLRKVGITVMALEGVAPDWLGPDLPPAIAGGRSASMIEVLPQPAARAKPAEKADETQATETETKPATAKVMAAKVAAKAQPAAAVATLKDAATGTRPQPGMVVTHPIRSGQRIAHDGDVTVVGSVASGAEIVAGGSIHIYGTLRGRAVAGASGNAEARIFARRFEAELIAIDGVFRTAEDLGPDCRGRAVQAFVDGEQLRAVVLE